MIRKLFDPEILDQKYWAKNCGKDCTRKRWSMDHGVFYQNKGPILNIKNFELSKTVFVIRFLRLCRMDYIQKDFSQMSKKVDFLDLWST